MKAETNARSPYRNLIYTALIIAAVAVALSFPDPFREINGFQLKKLIVPLLQIIMLGMGTTMSLKDFEGVVRQPRAVFIGVTCHFVIMPLLGYTLANTFSFPPEIAAGVVLIGCSPSGLASNVMLHCQSQRTAFYYNYHAGHAAGPPADARTDEVAGGSIH